MGEGVLMDLLVFPHIEDALFKKIPAAIFPAFQHLFSFATYFLVLLFKKEVSFLGSK